MLHCLHQSIDLMTERQLSLESESSLDIIDNSNIGYSFLDMHELHLNGHGVGKLALNFVKRIKSILNSGSAKQKLKEVHSKISSFWRSSDNPRSDKPETIYALSHNLNEETIKCKKHLAFSTSKSSMIMSSFSAKENTNLEGKSKNDNKIQDESQKCENFTDFLFNNENAILIKLLWLISV